jgi:hypothetical protein
MNYARMQSIVSGLTGMASKVYDAVPIRESWTMPQISAELGRHGMTYGHAQVQGCLRSLKEQGLILESGGQFQRIQQRQRLAAVHTPPQQEENMPAPKTSDPVANLAEIAATLREQGWLLMAKADAVDAASIEAAEAIESSGEDGAKLRQLQALLKDISK